MLDKLRILVTITLLCAGTAFAFTLQEPADKTPAELTDIQERGQAATQWFYDGDFDKVVALGLTDAVSTAMQGGDALPGIRQQIIAGLGAEQEVLEEQVTEAQGMQVYLRTVRFEKVDRAVVQWAFDTELRIAGFFIRPVQ